MAFEQTWRWFGPKDPITLKQIKQTGAVGIVTALHHLPIGETWSTDEILKRKREIESEGLRWSVAESVPIHDDIKRHLGSYRQFILNCKESIRNLGRCGIDTVCYNFMPVLDWSRTDLEFVFEDGSITTKFEAHVLAAFDLFILGRRGADKCYNERVMRKAQQYYESLSERRKEDVAQTILLGFPGSLEAHTLETFRAALSAYDGIGDAEFRENLYNFIREITPVAEESSVVMAIHPDDPPWPLFDLPRVVSKREDIEQLLQAVDSPANGITLCTGSLGAGAQNNLVEMTENFAERINFVHLRNVTRAPNGDFVEGNHLDGDVDMYGVVRALLVEQERREAEKGEVRRMPMRPDHGHLMLADRHRENIYPGYSLFGRMRGLAELRGLELGIRRSLGF